MKLRNVHSSLLVTFPSFPVLFCRLYPHVSTSCLCLFTSFFVSLFSSCISLSLPRMFPAFLIVSPWLYGSPSVLSSLFSFHWLLLFACLLWLAFMLLNFVYQLFIKACFGSFTFLPLRVLSWSLFAKTWRYELTKRKDRLRNIPACSKEAGKDKGRKCKVTHYTQG